MKKGALLGDFESLLSHVRQVIAAFKADENEVNNHLGEMKLEVQALLTKLERSYYSSQLRGRLVTAGASDELREIYRLAAECETQPEGKK